MKLLMTRLNAALKKRSELLRERESFISQDEILLATNAYLVKANRSLLSEYTLLGIIHSCEIGN